MPHKERLTYIDILKGLGITFVVFGHITRIHLLREYIWNFHMPLFFFISGLLFNPVKYSSFNFFFKSRIKSIYIPYVFFFLITFFYWLFIERQFRGGEYTILHQLIGLIYGTYEGSHLNFNGALWFLPCLFSVEIIFYFISKIKSKTVVISILIISFMIGTLLLHFQLNILPLGLHTAFFGIIFYGTGYLLKNKIKHQYFHNKIFQWIIILILFIIQLLCLGKFYGTIEKTTITYIVLAFTGIYLYLFLSKKIKTSKLIEFLGKNSLVILAFQEQIYRAVIYIFSKIVNINQNFLRHDVLFCILITTVTLSTITPFIFLYNKYSKTLINKLIQ